MSFLVAFIRQKWFLRAYAIRTKKPWVGLGGRAVGSSCVGYYTPKSSYHMHTKNAYTRKNCFWRINAMSNDIRAIDTNFHKIGLLVCHLPGLHLQGFLLALLCKSIDRYSISKSLHLSHVSDLSSHLYRGKGPPLSSHLEFSEMYANLKVSCDTRCKRFVFFSLMTLL